MGRFKFFIIVVFLIITRPVTGQNIEEFHTRDLIGYWQADSASQLGVKERLHSNAISPDNTTLSNPMDLAIKSREYIFQDEGNFTAKWVMGERQSIVNGKWEIIGKNKITIEVDGTMTEYTVLPNGMEGIVLTPIRARHGVIHELYFIKKNEE